MNPIESATGGVWEFPGAEERRYALAIGRKHGLPEPVCLALAMRGVAADDVPEFLEPSLRREMPDPAGMADMPDAAERLAKAVRDRESIAVFGDYDVDGACSVALLVGWLRALGIEAEWRIPHRIRDGYGPQPKRMAELGAGRELVIVADSGSSLEALPGLTAAREAGADVIVADHHSCEIASGGRDFLLVNPKRPDDRSGLEALCAAGVVFMLLVATARELRRSDWFGAAGMPEPDLKEGLDLVALATVADAVPLEGINRALVQAGLRQLRKGRRVGLRELLHRTRVSGTVTAHHLGWNLGPQLNAPGRVAEREEQSRIPVRLLLAERDEEARRLVECCSMLNTLRKEAQSRVLEDVDAARFRGVEATSLAWYASPDARGLQEPWHPGVVGIVAGRLSERHRRPAIVLTRHGGALKGSGRSWGEYDLGEAVRRARVEGLLLKGGGHAGAVGVEVLPNRVEEAMDRIRALLEPSTPDGAESRARTRVVGTLQPSGLTLDLVRSLESVGPFGQAAPHPRVVLSGVRLRYPPRLLSHAHYQMFLSDDAGTTAKAMAFSVAGSPLGEVVGSLRSGDLIDAMGEASIDTYQGKSQAFLRLEDVALR